MRQFIVINSTDSTFMFIARGQMTHRGWRFHVSTEKTDLKRMLYHEDIKQVNVNTLTFICVYSINKRGDH